jgi:hypothetical protein
MFTIATRSHTHKRTDWKGQEICFWEEYSGQALPVHSHWIALNLRQLPTFQGPVSSNKTALSLTILGLLWMSSFENGLNTGQKYHPTSHHWTFCLQFCMCANVRKNVDVCVCVWWRGGWVGVHIHVHARKPTTVQLVKCIVTKEYAFIIPLEVYEKGWQCPCEMLIAPPSLWLKVCLSELCIITWVQKHSQ